MLQCFIQGNGRLLSAFTEVEARCQHDTNVSGDNAIVRASPLSLQLPATTIVLYYSHSHDMRINAALVHCRCCCCFSPASCYPLSHSINTAAAAAQPVALVQAVAPYSSVYRPAQSFKAVVAGNGTDAGAGGSRGVWTLTVTDKAEGDVSR
jgi:hypothetical protein